VHVRTRVTARGFAAAVEFREKAPRRELIAERERERELIKAVLERVTIPKRERAAR